MEVLQQDLPRLFVAGFSKASKDPTNLHAIPTVLRLKQPFAQWFDEVGRDRKGVGKSPHVVDTILEQPVEGLVAPAKIQHEIEVPLV